MLSSLLLVLLGACGPTLPKELENPYQYPHPQCNPASHFWGKGMADTPQASIDMAHMDIAKQISSQIESQSVLLNEYEKIVVGANADSKTSTLSRNVLRNEIRTKSSFSHNELIVNLIPPQESKGTYHTLACLDRRKAGAVLEQELQGNFQHFVLLVGTAKEQYAKKDIGGFAAQFHKASVLRTNIVADLYIIRSITATISVTEQDFTQMWRELDEMASTIRASLAIGTHVQEENLSTNHKQLVADAVRKSFSDVGVKTVDATECTPRTSHIANISLRSNCTGPGTMGYNCRPMLDVHLHNCSTQESVTVGLQDPHFSGQDYYNTDKAMQNAIEKLNTVSFRTVVQTELQTVFPLQ